jgi:V/A-type H+-transporting ATPase subunit F
MLKIAFVGDKESSLPFRGVGIEAIICQEDEEAKGILQKLSQGDYGIIFITESLSRGCLDVIEELNHKRELPVITIIPDFLKKSPGIAEKRLKNWIKQAVGMELPE